jgi:hypothetical protein
MEVKDDHLFARASGVRTRDSVVALTNEIFDATVANGLSKTLIDVKELEGRLGALDNYLIVTEVFQKLRGKGVNKAAIVDEQAPSLQGWFLETVARNRGFNIRIFTDHADALEWIKS